MNQGPRNSQAFVISALVFFFLVIVGLFIWTQFPIPQRLEKTILLASVFFSIALVAVTVYQSFKVHESAHAIAEGMTRDMLTYSRELFSELYRNSPVPYLLIDEQGNIESINFSAARFFHVELDALEGLNAFTFIEGEDIDKIALIPEYFRQQKFVNNVEVEVRRPDGQHRWAMLSLFSFTDAKRELKGLLTLVDITKQKQIDKAKTEFVSLASHQLRTPISGMKWNVELLLTAGAEKLSSIQHEYIEKISHGLERMDLLVSDFLSVSKFELGTLVPQYTQVLLADFLRNICDEYQQMVSKKNIRLQQTYEDQSLTIQSDTHLLHMITSNLIGNAVKYTRENGTVTVEVRREGAYAVVTVAGTGIGIPPEDQEEIFSKMFRATNARTQVTDGTGLGLYIAREALRVMGGEISFVSKENEGTTFTVHLPV